MWLQSRCLRMEIWRTIFFILKNTAHRDHRIPSLPITPSMSHLTRFCPNDNGQVKPSAVSPKKSWYPNSRGPTEMSSKWRGQRKRKASNPRQGQSDMNRTCKYHRFCWILKAIHLNGEDVTEKSVVSANQHNLMCKILDLKFSSLSIVNVET